MVGATPRGSLELWHRQHCEAKWKRHGSAPLEKAWTSSWQDSLANVKQTMNPCQKQREENMTRHISATPIQCWVMKRDHSVLHVSKYISFRQDEAKQVKTHYTSWTQRETSDFFKIKNKLSNKNNVKKKKKRKKNTVVDNSVTSLLSVKSSVNTIVEGWSLTSTIDMVSTMIDEVTANKLKATPLSINTVGRQQSL